MAEQWNHNVHYHDWILRQAPTSCIRALDVGCGDGILTEKLANKCSDVVGIDQSTEMIALATKRLAGRDNVTLLQGDFLDYPFAAELSPGASRREDAVVRNAERREIRHDRLREDQPVGVAGQEQRKLVDSDKDCADHQCDGDCLPSMRGIRNDLERFTPCAPAWPRENCSIVFRGCGGGPESEPSPVEESRAHQFGSSCVQAPSPCLDWPMRADTEPTMQPSCIGSVEDQSRSPRPSRTARWEPAASMTARMSSIRSLKVGGFGTGSDRPVPRLSNRIRRLNDVSRFKN